jgi:hypothetical protein
MRAYIGPYDHWFKPARWLENLVLWFYGFGKEGWDEKKNNPGAYEEYDALREKIHENPVWNVCNDVQNWINNRTDRTIKVRIDPYDTWGMDDTLTHIILPMLKQLRATKHGSPSVDDEDVPENLRSTTDTDISAEELKNGIIDKYLHARWEWVFDEIIWAFEQLADRDVDDKFHYDLDPEKSRFEPGISLEEMMSRGGFDRDGYMAWQARKTRALTLFGKYFESLWD